MAFAVPVEEQTFSAPEDEAVAPEGSAGAFFRPIASNIFPSLATAAGGLASGLAASETGPGAIVADVVGGTAAGAAAKGFQDWAVGDETAKRMQAQEAANLAEHPFWAKMGTMIGQLPSVLGGGARFTKGAAETALGRAGESAVLGARMGGSGAAQQEVGGNKDVSIPEEIIKGALTFGPTGLLGPAKSLLGAVGIKAPTDAALMATSSALYDKVVHGKDINPVELSKQVGADIPGFMLLNAFSHGVGMHPSSRNGFAAPSEELSSPSPVHQEALDNLSKVEQIDSEFAKKIQVSQEIINEGAQNPDTSLTAQAAAEKLTTELPKAEQAQTEEITEAVKPLTETPTTEENATPQIQQQESIQPKRESGSEGGEAPEAGSSDSVLRTEEGQGEKIVAATFTDENGTVHEAPNHTLAAKKAGVDAPISRADRETYLTQTSPEHGEVPEYGFMVQSPDGTKRVVTRMEAARIAKENGQLIEGKTVRRRGLHSDDIEMPQSEASESPLAPETPPESQTPMESPEKGPKEASGGTPETLALKNEHMDALAKEAGLPEILKDAPFDTKEAFVRAEEKMKLNPLAGKNLVEQLDKTGAVADKDQVALLTHEERRIANGIKAARRILADPNSSDLDKADAKTENQILNNELGMLHHVSRRTGRESSLSLLMRKGELKEDFSYAGISRRLSDALDRPLNEKEQKRAQELSDALEPLKKAVEEAESQENSTELDRADEVLSQLKQDIKKNPRKIDKSDLLQRLKDFKASKSNKEPSFSRPIEPDGLPEVSEADQNAAVTKLKQTEIGRKILRDLIIVPDWQRAIARPEFSEASRGEGFSGDIINKIKEAEGFFDPVSGKSVVIRDNVRTRAGETPELAVRRVLLHERVGHEGVDALRSIDPKFDADYRRIVSQIPKEELNALKARYKGADPDTLVKEWIADEFGKLDPDSLPDPKTTFGKLWQAVKDFLSRYFQGATDLDQKVRDLMQQVVKSPDALESRRGFGDVMASTPEEQSKDVSEVPHGLLSDIARLHVQEGVKDVHDLTSKMKQTLEEAGITADENGIHRALSKYGKIIKPSKEEAEVQLRDLKSQMRLLSQLKDAKGGVMPTLTGMLRDKPSAEARELEKQVKEEIRSRDLHRGTAEQKRASALDAKKQRLENEIEDVTKQIADLKEGKNIALRTKKEITGAEDLESKLSGLRAELDQVIKDRQQPAPEPGDYFAEISRKLEATEKRIKVLEAKEAAGDLSVDKGEVKPSHPILDEARKKLKAINERISKARSEAERPEREAQKAQDALDDAQAKVVSLETQLTSGDISKNPVKRKAVSDELQSVRDQIKGLNKALAKARSDAEAPARAVKAAERDLKAAKDRVESLQNRLDKGELTPVERPKKPVSPELQAERDKLKELNKQMAERRAELNTQTPPTEAEHQRAIDSILKRLKEQSDELDRRMREKDFSKVQKKSPTSTKEIEAKKIALSKKRQDYENEVFKNQQSLRTGSQKFWDGAIRAKRAFLLSSVTVFGKLFAAVHARALTTTLEEMINHGIHAVAPEGLTSKAKLEGRGDVSGYAKAYVKAFSKWMDDIKDIWKSGKTDIDSLHGEYRGERDEGWDSILGRLHYMMKAPAKRAAFEHAQGKLTDAAIRDGKNPLDDDVKATITAGAYKAANRAIFMQDNAVVNAFRAAVSVLEKYGDKHNSGGAKGLSRAMRVLFPIVKVPTNMAAEALQYAGGVPVGLVKLAKVWHKGFEHLKPEEADIIMRELKKGSIGTALMALGFLASGSVGGYWQEHEKRKVGEPGPGGVKVGGVEIPSWLMHSPGFAALQMGATFRRVAEAHTKSGEQNGKFWGGVAALYGMLSETPFINEMTRLGNLNSQRGREQIAGDLIKAQVEPQILQQAAKLTDSGPPRKAESIGENLELGIPGLRQNVGLAIKDALPPSEHGKAPKSIENYARDGGHMPGPPIQSELKKHNPSLTRSKWNRYTEVRGGFVKQMLLNEIPQLRRMDADSQRLAISAISKDATDKAKRQLDLK